MNSIFQNPSGKTCVPLVPVNRAATVLFALHGHEKDLRTKV